MATTGYAAALDTNDITIGYSPETTWGTTAAVALQLIRLESEGFIGSKSRMRPNEIDVSGQASAAITVKEESTGTLNFSVSAGLATNVLLAGSLKGIWTTPIAFVSGAATCSLSSGSDANKLITLTATDGAFTTTNPFVKGQFVKVSGIGTLPYNFIGRVLTVAATILTLDCCSGTVPTTKTAGEMGVTTIKGSMLRNGTTINTFTIEKKLAAALFLQYRGALPTGGSLDVGVGEYLKGTLSFLNKQEVSATTTCGTGGPTAAPTATVINSVSGIGSVWRGVDTGVTPGVPTIIGGNTTPIGVQKIGVKWDLEGAAAQYAIGSSSAAGVRSGKTLVTGTLSTYFKDFSLYTQFTNEQAGPISFYAIDGLSTAAGSKGYVITFCNATIMNPKIVAGGPGQDVMADFDIEGNPDISSTSVFGGCTIQIDYFA